MYFYRKEFANQLWQLCTARTAWSESDQAVRTVHSCNSWWLALLWSDSVIKLVSVLFGTCTTLVVTKCWPMVIRQPCGDQWKAEKLWAFWRWPITRCLTIATVASLIIEHTVNFALSCKSHGPCNSFKYKPTRKDKNISMSVWSLFEQFRNNFRDITLKCLSIGTPKAINFPFVSNEKFMFF